MLHPVSDLSAIRDHGARKKSCTHDDSGLACTCTQCTHISKSCTSKYMHMHISELCTSKYMHIHTLTYMYIVHVCKCMTDCVQECDCLWGADCLRRGTCVAVQAGSLGVFLGFLFF